MLQLIIDILAWALTAYLFICILLFSFYCLCFILFSIGFKWFDGIFDRGNTSWPWDSGFLG